MTSTSNFILCGRIPKSDDKRHPNAVGQVLNRHAQASVSGMCRNTALDGTGRSLGPAPISWQQLGKPTPIEHGLVPDQTGEPQTGMSYHGMFVDTSGASPHAMAQKPRRQAEVDVRWGSGEPPDCKQNASIMAEKRHRGRQDGSICFQDGRIMIQGGPIWPRDGARWPHSCQMRPRRRLNKTAQGSSGGKEAKANEDP